MFRVGLGRKETLRAEGGLGHSLCVIFLQTEEEDENWMLLGDGE